VVSVVSVVSVLRRFGLLVRVVVTVGSSGSSGRAVGRRAVGRRAVGRRGVDSIGHPSGSLYIYIDPYLPVVLPTGSRMGCGERYGVDEKGSKGSHPTSVILTPPSGKGSEADNRAPCLLGFRRSLIAVPVTTRVLSGVSIGGVPCHSGFPDPDVIPWRHPLVVLERRGGSAWGTRDTLTLVEGRSDRRGVYTTGVRAWRPRRTTNPRGRGDPGTIVLPPGQTPQRRDSTCGGRIASWPRRNREARNQELGVRH